MAEEENADYVDQENVVEGNEEVVNVENDAAEAAVEPKEPAPKKSPPKGGGSKLWLILLAVGIAVMLIAPIFMFAVVPGMKLAPADLETDTEYDGLIQMFNMDTFSMDTHNITALDTYTASGVDGDNLNIQFTETVTNKVTGTAVGELEADDYTFSIDRKTFAYTDADHEGQWVFPLNVEAVDYEFWNGDLGEAGTCEYIETIEHEGVSTYKFRMVEQDLVLDLADVFDSDSLVLLQSMGAVMTYDVEYIFWVDPDTGTIIDLEKHQDRFLTFPNLRFIPDDLQTVSVNEGNITLLDTATMSMPVINVTLTAAVTANGTLQSGAVLLINEVLKVMDTDNDVELPEYGHNITYAVNRATGEYVNVTEANFYEPGRWTFPVGITSGTDYLWAEDGAGTEYDAEYVGQEVRGGIPTYMYEATVLDDEYGFIQMGTALTGQNTTEMVFWVEPETGTVVDREVSATTMITFPDLRYLPEIIDDGDPLTPEAVLEGTLATLNQSTFALETMDIVTYVYYDTVGLDGGGPVLKINETMVVMNGTTVLPEYGSTASYGVHRKTAQYVDVTGFTTETRTGQFTFPVGILDPYPTGTPVANFTMWNSDIGAGMNTTYESAENRAGVDCLVYEMVVANVSIPLEQLLGSELIPGAKAAYNATYTYWVEPRTGIIIDMERNVTWKLITPSPGYMLFGSPSLVTYWGTLNNSGDGDININVVKNVTPKMNYTSYDLYGVTENWENSSIFMNITGIHLSSTNVSNIVYVALPHNMTHATAMYAPPIETKTENWTFSPNAITNQTLWNGDIHQPSNAEYVGYLPPSALTGGFNISLYNISYDNFTVVQVFTDRFMKYDANITFQVDKESGVILGVDKYINVYYYNSTTKLFTPGQEMRIHMTSESIAQAFMTAKVMQVALVEEAYGIYPDLVVQNLGYAQAVTDAAVAKANSLGILVVLSEQTIVGGILQYQTNETDVGIGALEAYATGLQLALFSGNTVQVLDQDMEYSNDNIADSKASADEIKGKLAFGELYVPMILVAIGAVFVVLGLIFKIKK